MNEYNWYLLLKKPISSKVVPFSRGHAFAFWVSSRNHTVHSTLARPAELFILSSGTDRGSRMMTAMSKLDCVGRQNLAEGTSKLKQLAAHKASVAPGSDMYPFTRADALNAVRCIDPETIDSIG